MDENPAREAIGWLVEKGHLRKDDCVMNPCCGNGEFTEPISRSVRIMVCMDTDPRALDATAKRCVGGCKVEKFNRDWTSYVPTRGSYDACVMSPSRLSRDIDAVRRMELVSSRSCVVVIPGEADADEFASELGREVSSAVFERFTILAWEK